MNEHEIFEYLRENLKIETTTLFNSYYTGGDPLFKNYKRVTIQLKLNEVVVSESSFDIDD